MKTPSEYNGYLHIVVKDLKTKDEGINKVKELTGITVILGGFEKNHSHFFCHSKYYKRYVNENRPFKNKLRILEVKDTEQDYKKVISYIFKDKDTYEDYSRNKHNIDYCNRETDKHFFKLVELDLAEIYKLSSNTKGSNKPQYKERYIDRLLLAYEEDNGYKDLSLDEVIDWVIDYTSMNTTALDQMIQYRFVYTIMNRFSKQNRKNQHQRIKEMFKN